VKKIITGKTSMQKLFRLCLWQVILGLCTAGAFSISMLSTSGSAFSQEIPTQERGIRMRGPKSTDAFPYDRYGPITQTDTLWKIALTVRPDSRLSVYQVMEALYQANPNSFVNNNLNHLVQGQYLKIPSFDRMMSVNTTVAKQKSRQDDKDWQKKQPKKVKTPKVPSVNKKDLDTVKVEINDQLQKIDNEQQKRLENIQNDVLDSIDGLQAILKENENLRQRLTSFNNQLGTMQKEVAKGKEIKLQMDDMIRLQQALLEKAQSREQELLLEKQQAALEKDNVFSSLWFIVLMATLPAILILLAVAFIFKRRKTETINSESVPKKKSKGKPENIINEPKDEIDEIDELSLDDDLSIDLLDEEGKSEDDVIHLDDDDEDDLGDLDDLDDLDDLEDILLDDDELEGGELGQDDLDSLLMEDDAIEEEENDALVDNQLDQSDLDDLLGDLGDDEFEIEDEDFSSKDELDIDDALLESMAIDEAPAVKKESSKADDDAQTEMSDPDDIDALLESMAADEGPVEEAAVVEEESVEEASSKADDDAQTEISDPDDIDALLESMATDETPAEEAAVVEEESVEEASSKADDAQTEISDPDDIDALLESMAADEGPLEEAAVVEEESVEEASSKADDDAQTEISDPDDIDALLESMATDETPAVEEESVEEASSKADDDTQTEMSNPDDIDTLLESMAADETPAEDAAVVEEASSKADDDTQTEMSDPDDIDALLESMAADETPAEDAAVVEEASSKADDDTQTEMSDPDDIDALLESMATDETPAEEAAVVEEESVEEASSKADDADDGQTEMSDPDDIDALLASMDVEGSDDDDNSEEEAVNKEEVKQEESQNKAKIESLTEEYVAPLLAADFSDLLAKSTKEDLTGIDTSQDDLVDDDFDIDALIADIENNTTDQNLIQDTEFDIGDDLAEGAFDEESLAELLNDEEAAVELSPDFSDQNVLADLLNDENNDKSQVSEATEINDIQELDSLDFDELLANIEEESSVASQSVDFNENLDVGDDFSLAEFDNISSNTHSNANKKTTKGEESFLSVDSLLSESQDEVSRNEPYDKSNIDVGLNEFPEFTNGVNKIDVDLDENGMAAKLDLAKVYIEIGDQDNAQVILQEVIKQGDNQQQVVAQELLDNL
jgi:pilus assembly protein FimV